MEEIDELLTFNSFFSDTLASPSSHSKTAPFNSFFSDTTIDEILDTLYKQHLSIHSFLIQGRLAIPLTLSLIHI